MSSLMLGAGMPAHAQDPPLPAISVGAGVRTSYEHIQFSDEGQPEDFDGSADLLRLNSARLYVNGSVTKNIKLTFTTEYNGFLPESTDNTVGIMDALAQVTLSPKVNFWMGRFLPPSDRSNLYGPYYAHHWNVYIDGIQDSYPMIHQGRANGVMYWGQFAKFKVSGGIFDGPTLEPVGGAGNFGGDPTTLLAASRFQFDFWDPEDGYYQNSTYYGEKNILAFGLAGQIQGEEHTAWSADFLLERKVGTGGAFTVEAEWARYSQLGLTQGGFDTTDGGYILGSFLFPTMSTTGKWEILGKYAQANSNGGSVLYPSESMKTTEFNLNYIIKQFNARLMMFFVDQRFDVNDAADTWKIGAGLQLQM